MSDFLETSYYGNPGSQWLTVLGFIGLSIIGGLIFYWLFGRTVRFLTQKTETKLDDIFVDTFEEPLTVLIIGWGVLYSLSLLTLTRLATSWIEWGFEVFQVILLAWFILRFYGALHKAYAVSFIASLVSRGIFVLMLFGAVFILVRLWIVQPTFCYPDCMGISLTGLNMSGLELRQANFVEANLRGSDLSRGDLNRADLSATDLTGVTFREANLQYSKFLGANLQQTDLRETNLHNTQLNGADLSQADLTRTNLTRVSLNGTVLERAKLIEVDLSGKNLSGVDLSRADLAGANLDGADLSGASLSGADLSGASLRHANLSGAWLNLTNLTGVDLVGANLNGASLIGSNLASADLTQSKLDGATLIGANLNGANLKTADLTGFRFFQVELRSTDLLLDPVLEELNLLQVGQVLKDGNLSGIQFNNQTIWPPDKIAILANILGLDKAAFKSVSEVEQATTTVAAPSRIYRGQIVLSRVDPALIRGDIYIAGSATVVPLTQVMITEFVEQGYTGQFQLSNVGSEAGFRLFCQTGEADIAIASRPITLEETESCVQIDREPIEFQVGVDALVVVVNPLNNFIVDASVDELQQIFTAQNWSDVNSNWPIAPISRVVLDEDSGAFGLFTDEVFDGETQPLLAAPNTQFVSLDEEVVQGVSLNPTAVGFVTVAAYQENSETLKLLSVDGIEPTLATVGAGQYPLARPLLIYSAASVIRDKSQVGAFINFYLTNTSRLIESVGYFPSSPGAIDEAERNLLEVLAP